MSQKNNTAAVVENTIVDNTSSKKYVVLRNGLRVSDAEYSKKEDANEEFQHWNKILSKWPDGTKVSIELLK